MANVFSCNDYVIHSILKKEGINYDQDPPVSEYQHWVILKRLPSESYVMNTEIHIDTANSANFLPEGLTDDQLVSNVLPIVNTYLAAFDAEFSTSNVYTSPDFTNFELRI